MGRSAACVVYYTGISLLIIGSGRPVSRILLYPAIHLRRRCDPTGPLGGPRLPARRLSASGTIWLARTGRLPGRSLAGYRRWALTPPFHPSPVSGRDVTCYVSTAAIGWSALCCTWRDGGLAPRRPSGSWPERPLLRVRTLLYEPSPGVRNAATGRTARIRRLIIPYGVRDGGGCAPSDGSRRAL